MKGERKTVGQYLDEFTACLGKIEATNITTKKILLETAVEKSVCLLRSVKKTENFLFFIGNGGSAAIAGHQVTDFIRTCKIRAFAPLEHSLLTCMANDFGYENVFAEPLKLMVKSGDVLIAISSSGQSKNILNAVSVFLEKKCRVVTLSGFKPDNPLRFMGDINFYVPSGSFRFVESAHLFLCNLILDFTIRSLEKKEWGLG